MNLDSVRSISQLHLTETRACLAHVVSLEPIDIQAPVPLEGKILNGLYYVQLYSAIERTVNEVVQRTLSHINAVGIQNDHAQTSFCTVTLFAEMMSIRDSASRSFLEKASNVFARQADQSRARINETCLSLFLQNIRMKTLDELSDAFGIQRLNIDPRIRTTLNEIADNRNKVAHGRESASIVGERHRSAVLREKTDQIETLLYTLIDAFEAFYIQKSFIKTTNQGGYAI